ncbi:MULTISPECIES: hypothetical protein [Bizionia]|uniref:Lipoprotein n=1 Tax=Bizionia algoritergicola TaxID=291187 RepID=A0A5D0R1E8_9FLAO|nr:MULTISPECIES: hypothetical protein [Bizionia]OBX21336.1 hypothetical protein BAA08_13090 [Bizionia sp. APA-3]TYB74815.1 hypothetical protein ES675_01385 [Bizionia algoritergicola]
MKIYKLFFLVVTVSLFVFSCSTDNEHIENKINESQLTNTLLKGLPTQKLIIGSNTYLLNSSGYHTKYTNGIFKYDFKYSSPVSFTYTETQSEFKISNPKNNEFVKLSELKILNNDKTSFTLETSSGFIIEDVVLEHNSNKICWPCIIIPLAGEVIETIIESVGDNYDSNCALAIEACEFGVQSIQIIDQGWFSSASCTVICK